MLRMRLGSVSIAACLPALILAVAGTAPPAAAISMADARSGAAATPAATPTNKPAAVSVPNDFNGDGLVDLALGSQATVAGFPFAGMVPVVYGTGTTLTARRQRIQPRRPGDQPEHLRGSGRRGVG